MRVGIMQPYIFPYIGYYQLVNAVDTFVFLDDVYFINRGWINRNNLLVNGRAALFTIPLQNASQNRLINSIATAVSSWKEKTLKTIEMAYKKAPYYQQVLPLIQESFADEGALISDMAKKSIQLVAAYLQMETRFIASSSQYDNADLKGADRIINISQKEGASDYINPIGGLDLYNKEQFEARNIRLHFIKTNPIVYSQGKHEFVPYLSMIDVLMFNSVEQISNLLNEYELLK
jgi:hypothetical protein